jgi:FkbM family methyltransferase
MQIGAPVDTLLAGRSRAAYFCLLARETGKVVIVEPDEESIKMFQAVAQKQGIRNAIFAPSAAWSEKGNLRIFINPKHPASNFVYGTKDLNDNHMGEFYQTSVAADTVDSILTTNHIRRLDLASITTNGSEREIIKGMVRIISQGVSYISLARTGNHTEFMKSIGYEPYAYDDRGITFHQSKILCLDELREIL